jgi:hypothetical protein
MELLRFRDGLQLSELYEAHKSMRVPPEDAIDGPMPYLSP